MYGSIGLYTSLLDQSKTLLRSIDAHEPLDILLAPKELLDRLPPELQGWFHYRARICPRLWRYGDTHNLPFACDIPTLKLTMADFRTVRSRQVSNLKYS
jgi:hypothetical protein